MPYTNNQIQGSRRERFSNLNIGLVIFFVILIYLVTTIILFLTSRKTDVYEVRMGALSDRTIYRGIALRQEKVETSSYTGYINFYNKETDRIGAQTLAYTIDEDGRLADDLDADKQADQRFTASDYAAFRREVISFTGDFRKENFQTLYDFRNSIMSASQKVSNRSILGSIKDLESNSIHMCYAHGSGDVVYSVDGLEKMTFDKLTPDTFNENKYKRTVITNNQQVKEGDPVFKLISSERWSVAIQVPSEETAQKLVSQKYVRVRFLQNSLESWAHVTDREGEDGSWYVNLEFTNSMVTFCTERFLDLEIYTSQETGLKVPVTSITKGEFYLVPKEFLTTGAGGERGVLLEVYSEDGGKSTQFVASTPYSETEDYYYLDSSGLSSGEIIDMPDSTRQYTIGESDELVGVYYINKGYADFRQIRIIYQNEDYAIVEPNSAYGLMEYDYIVLHADTINPDEFVTDTH